MKKLITFLLVLISLAMTPNVAEAQKTQKFVLLGHVDANIADSCYNIYITNVRSKITDNDLVACVPVKKKAFRYEIELDEIMSGRIRAIFPGDNLCSAWIDLYFIPGLTIDMTVHNGYYTIHNENEYKAEVKEWQFYYPEQPPRHKTILDTKTTIEKSTEKVDPEEVTAKSLQLETALDAYQTLLDELRTQLSIITYDTSISSKKKQKEIDKISNQIEEVTKSMKQLIDKYANSNY